MKANGGSRSIRGRDTTPSMRTHERIYAAVRRIPRGRVATYGQIAEAAGLPRQPRLVGYALHALPSGTAVPWHRVVNARGMVSIRSDGSASLTQRLLLEREGVTFDARGRLPLDRFRWNAGQPKRVSAVRKKR
jgi:methylated-DNA-protein-cysteine methyltransferase-like protein